MSASPPTARRFTFDTVFDDAGGVVIPAAAPTERTFNAAELEAARRGGFADGEQSAVALSEAAAAAALADIAQVLRAALSALSSVAHDHRTASAELALACGRAIASAALERFPEAAAEAAMEALAREIETAPRLLVSVPPAQAERLQAALTRTAEGIGYTGALVVRPDPKTSACAFSFDWGDGRATFDAAAAAARVGEALSAALAAEGLHAEPLTLDLAA